MEITYSPKSARPFQEPPARNNGALKWSSDDYWGAFSIENFCSAGALSYTHEDAKGWLDYLRQFHDANFWFQDGGVQPWAYYEDYDNWQDTYGIDAVLAVYHSGHGAMDGNGVFYAPVGSDWGGLGCTVRSDQMRIGNEQARYLFWSTCVSLRVLEGHNPIRTWSPANLGFRMLFGFETVSVDNPDYGKFFWEEWNRGKSFSTAWMDASWRISPHQAPSVVACGANQQEATDRLFNERIFAWETVSHNWWQWRWYNARSTRDANRDLPAALLTAQLVPVEMNEPYVQTVMERYSLDMRLPSLVNATPAGNFFLQGDLTRLSFGSNGVYEVQLARPNLSNGAALSSYQARAIAENAVRSYGLDRDSDLIVDAVRQGYTAGGSDQGSGERIAPTMTETTVQYRQLINGLPVLNADQGTVRISIDNDGTVTKIHSGVRAIDHLSDRPKTTITAPQNGSPVQPRAIDVAGYERMLGQQWTKRMADWVVRGSAPVQYETIPGTTEVGYQIRGNEAILVAQRLVEVDFGNGYRKRYQITTPIVE